MILDENNILELIPYLERFGMRIEIGMKIFVRVRDKRIVLTKPSSVCLGQVLGHTGEAFAAYLFKNGDELRELDDYVARKRREP